MGINYTIISQPVNIECECPPFGATVTCPTCGAEIELDEYEYD